MDKKWAWGTVLLFFLISLSLYPQKAMGFDWFEKNTDSIKTSISNQLAKYKNAIKKDIEIQTAKFIMRNVFKGDYIEEIDLCYRPIQLNIARNLIGMSQPVRAKQAQLQFSAPGFENEYDIYLNNKLLSVPSSARTSSSFFLNDLTPKTDYEVYIIAHHVDKDFSLKSNTVSFTTPKINPLNDHLYIRGYWNIK